jgi:hypothetical protein
MILILLVGLLALMIIAQVNNLVTELEYEKGKRTIFQGSKIWKGKYLIIILTSYLAAVIINQTGKKEFIMMPIYVGILIVTIIRIVEKVSIYNSFKGFIVKSLIILSPFLS